MNNRYSTTWFELFLQPIQAAQSELEIGFITRYLPRPAYRRVLDLCCGQGRHTRLLAERGYQVVGVDRDAAALEEARRRSAGDVLYIQEDMRNLAAVPGSFDGVANLWQSFGYFDERTNSGIVQQIHQKLNPKGRLIVDLYHRGFFEQHQGVREFQRDGLTVTETKSMAGKRLRVTLDYGPGYEPDTFDWQLYTPDEMRELGDELGFSCLVACSGFDDTLPASAGSPRMQLVFEKQ